MHAFTLTPQHAHSTKVIRSVRIALPMHYMGGNDMWPAASDISQNRVDRHTFHFTKDIIQILCGFTLMEMSSFFLYKYITIGSILSLLEPDYSLGDA